MPLGRIANEGVPAGTTQTWPGANSRPSNCPWPSRHISRSACAPPAYGNSPVTAIDSVRKYGHSTSSRRPPPRLHRHTQSGMAAQIRHLQRLIEMEFARAPVIVEPVRDIAILLDLAERQTRANGVYRAGRHKEAVARLRSIPMQQPFDLARKRRRAHSLAGERLLETERQTRARLSPQHVPHFGLARTGG